MRQNPAMRIIRASEIGSYLYCHRSWWYRISGIEPENKRELQAGTEIHYQHGRNVLVSSFYKILGFLLGLVAIGLLVYYLVALQ
jgi:CRISPR/Cas system-associated exonuclease Cas4 (RecB family)